MFGTGVFEHSTAFGPFWSFFPSTSAVGIRTRMNFHKVNKINVDDIMSKLLGYPQSFQPRSSVSIPGTLLLKGFILLYSSFASLWPALRCLCFISLTASEHYCATDVSKKFLTNLIETTSAKFSWFSSVELSIGTTSPSINLEGVPPPTRSIWGIFPRCHVFYLCQHLCSQKATDLGLILTSFYCTVCTFMFWTPYLPPFLPYIYVYILFIFNFSFQF